MYVVKTQEKDSRIKKLEDLVDGNHTNEAIKYGDKLLDEGLVCYDVYYQMGRAHNKESNKEKALKSFKKALNNEKRITLYHKIATLQREVSSERLKRLEYRNWGIDEIDCLVKPLENTHPIIKLPLSLLSMLLTSPYWLSVGIGKEALIDIEKKRIRDAYEAAIKANPTKELFEEAIDYYFKEDEPSIRHDENYIKDVDAVIKYSEMAVEHFKDEAFFYAMLSKAHKKKGNNNDSYAYMWKAIELKYNDAEFIEEHFGKRIFEAINNDGSMMIFYKLLKHNKGENWNNYEILKMISGHYRQKKEHALKSGFFETLSKDRLRTSRETDLSAEYDLISIEAYTLSFKENMINRKLVNVPVNQAAYDKIVSRFAALKSKGFDVDNGHFNRAIGYRPYFRENVNNTTQQPPKPKLELLH